MSVAWVTGANGFIGRYLSNFLHNSGYCVAGIGHGAWTSESAREYGIENWVTGEIEHSNLNKLLELTGVPTVVFHLAGGSSVGPSFAYPLEDFYRTVESTAKLLEWVSGQSHKISVVCASSAAVYGDGHTGKIKETAGLNPFSPYGFNKVMMETLCKSYGKNFGVQTCIVRLFSVFGVGLEKQLLWDLCIKLSKNEKKVLLHGTGGENRDWLHVSDAVRLLALVAKRCGRTAPVFNGGTGRGESVKEITEMVVRAWGGGTVEFSGKTREGDPGNLVADIGKILQIGYISEAVTEEEVYKVVSTFKKLLKV